MPSRPASRSCLSLDHSSTQPISTDRIPQMFRSCYWTDASPLVRTASSGGAAALAMGQAQGDAGGGIPQEPAVLAAEPEAVQRLPAERDADRTQDGGDHDRDAQPRQPPRQEPPAECGD